MTVLVTGGSKGIGRGIAERFGAEGAHVLINYANDDAAAAATVSAVEAKGGRATAIRCDLGSHEGIARLGAMVREHTDGLDQIVHGAIWPRAEPTMEISIQDFDKALWLNGSSLLALAQELRPLLSRGASVFHISSRGSKLAVPNYVAVGAPKALAESLVRYLAVALAPDGIRVNTVSCSGVLTEAVRRIRPDADERAIRMAARNPSGRNVEPDDVAAMVHHLSSPELAMVTGREFFVDGGLYSGTD